MLITPPTPFSMAVDTRLTITIPTYNRHQDVQALVRQIVPQLIEGDELIVSDDSLPSDGLSELRTFPQVQLRQQNPRLGMVGNWNFCLKAGSNPWVCLIHDDDHVMPNALDAIRRVCTIAGAPALIGHAEWEKPAQYADAAFHWRFREPGSGAALNAEICPSGVTLHRSIVDTLGGYNPMYKYSADMEFFPRVCAVYPSYIIERPRILEYVFHKNNYQFKTWDQPDFLAELRRVEHDAIAQARVDDCQSERLLNERMIRDILHMIRESQSVGERRRVRRFCTELQRPHFKQLLGLRKRIATTLGALLGRYPSRLM